VNIIAVDVSKSVLSRGAELILRISTSAVWETALRGRQNGGLRTY
jgi:hypothetical protein